MKQGSGESSKDACGYQGLEEETDSPCRSVLGAWHRNCQYSGHCPHDTQNKEKTTKLNFALDGFKQKIRDMKI